MCWPASTKYSPNISSEPPGPANREVSVSRTRDPPRLTVTVRTWASRPTSTEVWPPWTVSSAQSWIVTKFTTAPSPTSTSSLAPYVALPSWRMTTVARAWCPIRTTVSYTHLRAHETRHDLVCRLLL